MFFFTKCQILAKLSAVILKKGNMRSSAAQRSRIGRESANTKIEKSTRCKMKFPFYLLSCLFKDRFYIEPSLLKNPFTGEPYRPPNMTYSETYLPFPIDPAMSSHCHHFCHRRDHIEWPLIAVSFLQTEIIQQIDYKGTAYHWKLSFFNILVTC